MKLLLLSSGGGSVAPHSGAITTGYRTKPAVWNGGVAFTFPPLEVALGYPKLAVVTGGVAFPCPPLEVAYGGLLPSDAVAMILGLDAVAPVPVAMNGPESDDTDVFAVTGG